MRPSAAITKEAAAKRLGVTVRTVRNHMNRRLLRPGDPHRPGSVDESSVERLAIVHASPRQSSIELSDLRMRVQQLEARVSTVQRLLGLNIRPLRLRDQELAALHRMAEHAAREGWSPHEELRWVDVFERLALEDLAALKEVTGMPNAWAPFYRLCSAMRFAALDPSLTPRFRAAACHLARLAAIWVYADESSVATARRVLKRETKLDGRVLRKLRRRRAINAREGTSNA